MKNSDTDLKTVGLDFRIIKLRWVEIYNETWFDQIKYVTEICALGSFS